MSIGVGLGAFVQGMNAGISARDRIDAQRERRANKQALGMIDAQTQEAFQEGVQSGEFNPDQFDQFWQQYALPKYSAELMRQGEYEKAKYLEEWGASSAARRGGKLFASSLMKAQTGNAEGAIKDAIKAAEVNGYIERGGLELQGYEPLKDGDGNVIGYRFKLDTPEGDPIEQDVMTEDLPNMLARLINPVAAFQSQVEQTSEKKKSEAERAAELEDYEKKKSIDQKYKDPGDKDAKAYKAARDSRMENDFEFQDLSPEEQDKVIREDLQRARDYQSDQSGGRQSSAPAPGSDGLGMAGDTPPTTRQGSNRIVVDKVTGEPVPVDPSQQKAQPARQPVDIPAPEPRPQPAPTQRADATGMSGASLRRANRDKLKGGTGFRSIALDRIQKGEDPATVRSELAQKGMSDAEWRSTVMQLNNRVRS
jgi:hypothetical protein